MGTLLSGLYTVAHAREAAASHPRESASGCEDGSAQAPCPPGCAESTLKHLHLLSSDVLAAECQHSREPRRDPHGAHGGHPPGSDAPRTLPQGDPVHCSALLEDARTMVWGVYPAVGPGRSCFPLSELRGNRRDLFFGSIKPPLPSGCELAVSCAREATPRGGQST